MRYSKNILNLLSVMSVLLGDKGIGLICMGVDDE